MTKSEINEMKKNLKEVYRYLKKSGAPSELCVKQYEAIVDLAFEETSEDIKDVRRKIK